MTTPVNPAGVYLIKWSFTIGNAAQLPVKSRVMLDGATLLEDMVACDDSCQFSNAEGGHAVVTLTNAAHTFTIDYGKVTTGTATIEHARLTLWRIS